MNSDRALLALRKEMLLARCSTQRLKVEVEVEALRQNLRWPRAVAAAVSSPPGRSALFGLLWLVVGGGRVARIVKTAAAAVALAKLAGALLHRAKTPAEAGEAPAE